MNIGLYKLGIILFCTMSTVILFMYESNPKSLISANDNKTRSVSFSLTALGLVCNKDIHKNFT